jgi:hypothetical protein
MSTHAFPIAASVAALVLALPAAARDLGSGRWIDLTHPFNAESVYWPTATMFEKKEVYAGETPGGWYYSAYDFSAAEHGGTHLDAPIHFAEGANTADAIPVDQMIGPGFVIDVSAQAAADVDYLGRSRRAPSCCCGPAGRRSTRTARPTWAPPSAARKRSPSCTSPASAPTGPSC